MSEIVAPALHAPDADDLGVVRAIDRISASAGFIASVALAIMTIVVCYEVISRYVFNAPTTWVTEVSTYLFVAVVFLGLAEAQRANAHIQVEILVDRLGKEQRAFVELVGLWLGVPFRDHRRLALRAVHISRVSPRRARLGSARNTAMASAGPAHDRIRAVRGRASA